jgi:hypothetical protein
MTRYYCYCYLQGLVVDYKTAAEIVVFLSWFAVESVVVEIVEIVVVEIVENNYSAVACEVVAAVEIVAVYCKKIVAVVVD